MLIAGLLIGLVAGFAAGGRLDNLLAIRLRWPLLIFGALALRLGTEAALTRGRSGSPTRSGFRFSQRPTCVLAAGLWANRARPGMSLALVGIALNAVAILVNGGFMPVWEPSLTAAGFGRADVLSPINLILPAGLDAHFFWSAGPLGDIIPVPLPFVRNVLSLGDVILDLGLAFFLFAGLVRHPDETEPRDRTIHGYEPGQPVTLAGPTVPGLPGGVRAGTGLAASLVGAAALERPVVLGSSGAGLAAPTPMSSGGVAALPLPGALRAVAIRARHHPFVRLAVNGSFSALWTGQLISLLGDRVNQVALAALVYGTTNSAIAGSLTFVAATLPNLLFGPLAGVLVDRWDQKRVLVVSDLLRAAIVLFIPVSVSVNVVLAYPLVFLLTSVSIFFRPARTAVIPRVVHEDELVTANSATWLSETLADVIGYPFAGLFVAFLGSALSLAFWLDSVSYVASALLVLAVVIPPVVRSAGSLEPIPGLSGIRDDLASGWRFLRGRAGPAREHAAGRGGPADGRRHDRARPLLREGGPAAGFPGLDGGVRVHRDGDRGGQPGRRVRDRAPGRADREGPDGDRRIRRVRPRGRRPGPDDEPAAGTGNGTRDGRLEHGLHHPDPDALPGADARRHDRSGGGLPILGGLRSDDLRDGGERRSRDRGRGGTRARRLRRHHARGGPGRPCQQAAARGVTTGLGAAGTADRSRTGETSHAHRPGSGTLIARRRLAGSAVPAFAAARRRPWME